MSFDTPGNTANALGLSSASDPLMETPSSFHRLALLHKSWEPTGRLHLYATLNSCLAATLR